MFISVIPALKMPYGHCFFDYELKSGNAHVGDVLLLPFRNKSIACLVAKISPQSTYAGKAIGLDEPQKILKLPEPTAEFCISAARESFVSPPTMLNAWFRNIPKRLSVDEPHLPPRDTHRAKDQPNVESRYLVNRYLDKNGIIAEVIKNQANGRILILTPWQRRADFLAQKLNAPVLHAGISYGAAWNTWTGFLKQSHGVLVATRLGAWLAVIADMVIIDEPENDDYKQDELTPRYDVRRLVETATEFNHSLIRIGIGTTPNLQFYFENKNNIFAEDISADIAFARIDPKNRSEVEMLTTEAFNALEQAANEGKPVRILHTVLGSRGRIRCADCDWTMICEDCDIGYANRDQQAFCPRCLKTKPLPVGCPVCGSTNLSKAIIGSDALLKVCRQRFPQADIKVLDLHEWLQQSLRQNSVLIVTNIAYIGGYSEDIRRSERLLLAFRRLAAQSCVAKCKLVVQGYAPLIDSCPSWLGFDGVKKQWDMEAIDRQKFGYPPALVLAKLLVLGKLEDAEIVKSKLQDICELSPDWSFRGPYPVEYWSKTREPRCVFHIIPPQNSPRQAILDQLSVLTAFGILDLDPIAFFC